MIRTGLITFTAAAILGGFEDLLNRTIAIVTCALGRSSFCCRDNHRSQHMRLVLAILFVAFTGSLIETAKADPYRWCAEYSGGFGGGGTNCYFLTLEQCRAAVSGVGGFCRPNNFYDGRPVGTPEDIPPRKRR